MYLLPLVRKIYGVSTDAFYITLTLNIHTQRFMVLARFLRIIFFLVVGISINTVYIYYNYGLWLQTEYIIITL